MTGRPRPTEASSRTTEREASLLRLTKRESIALREAEASSGRCSRCRRPTARCTARSSIVAALYFGSFDRANVEQVPAGKQRTIGPRSVES